MLRLLLLLTFIIGCDDTYREDYPSITYEYNVDLPQDENGYYRMTLDREMWQTTQRIQGKVTSDSEWVDQIRINWESSHYWVLGDTLGYIYRRGLTDDMVYVNYDTLYITGFDGREVPTINAVSYPNCEVYSFGSECEVNTMIAPIKTMVGDTLRVTAWYIDFYQEITEKSINIILE
jgi:hypothetical protein|tara:strand:+ start:215 stop:745 length:531 start_codon:yes stop_codon:yes gene_type:complete